MEAEASLDANGSNAVLSPPASRSHTTATQSHLLMRSIAVACVVLALAAIFLACLKPRNADDFYWQAKTGQIILQSRHLPHTDPFSWTAHGHPWTIHGWLITVIFYLMTSHLPLWTIVLYKAGLAALACGLLLWRAWLRSGSWLLALALTLLAGMTLPEWADVRAEMLTLVLLSGLLLGLDLYARGRARWLPFVLPVVFVLWANVHPSVAVGLVLVVGWVLGEWLGRRGSGVGSPALRPLVLGLAVSAVALCLNPEGFGLYGYPVRLLSHPPVTDHVGEWSSPDFQSRSTQCFEALLLATPLAMALAGWRSGWSIGDALLLIVTAHAGLLYSRDVPSFAVAAAPVFAGVVAVGWQDGALRLSAHSILSVFERPAVRRVGAAVLIALLALLVYKRLPRGDQGRIAPQAWLSYTLDLNNLPRRGAAFLASGQCPGRLYNDYAWGGYLSWRLWPKRPVFADGRAEVYSKAGVLRDRLLIQSGAPGWQEALDRWGAQVVLTHKRSNLYHALMESPKWRLVFSGDVEDIHVREQQQ